jgi:cation diffusion facilitator CzcD-associated flavoprotein CzcO
VREGDAGASREDRRQRWGRSGTPEIAIVGAGFGGIGLGALLKRRGIDTFTIYDKADHVGGTWWHNRYPGAEVDTVSYVYSYAFKPYAWSRTHARRSELLRYLEETVEEFGLRSHLRLGVAVESAVWNDGTHRYALELGTGESADCHVLVAATGFLNIPKYPSWPGIDEFAGPQFHTARWEGEHDLADKTIAVVGTGSSATQIVPELAKIAKKVYLFQRQPGWIVPKDERDFSAEESARLLNPIHYRLERAKWFWATEKRTWRGAPFRPDTSANEMGRQSALAFIEREFSEYPDIRKAVTPDYPFWGKRLVFNSTFYASLKLPNVELVPFPVESATRTGLVDSAGVEHSVDVLVLATGFKTTDYLGTMEVRGRDGRILQDVWAGEPSAFLGLTVPGFPNFYMVYGPGTNGGEIVSMLMRQAEHIVGAVKRMRRQGVTALEVKSTWAGMYDAWLEEQVGSTSWAIAENYYKGPTGKIVTQWPYSPGIYGVLVRTLGRLSQSGRRRRVEEPPTDLKEVWTG